MRLVATAALLFLSFGFSLNAQQLLDRYYSFLLRGGNAGAGLNMMVSDSFGTANVTVMYLDKVTYDFFMGYDLNQRWTVGVASESVRQGEEAALLIGAGLQYSTVELRQPYYLLARMDYLSNLVILRRVKANEFLSPKLIGFKTEVGHSLNLQSTRFRAVVVIGGSLLLPADKYGNFFRPPDGYQPIWSLYGGFRFYFFE